MTLYASEVPESPGRMNRIELPRAARRIDRLWKSFDADRQRSVDDAFLRSIQVGVCRALYRDALVCR